MTSTGAIKIRCSSVAVAEEMAVLVGLEAARERGREMMLMEGDNQQVMRALRGQVEMPSKVELVASNVK